MSTPLTGPLALMQGVREALNEHVAVQRETNAILRDMRETLWELRDELRAAKDERSYRANGHSNGLSASE